MLGQPLPSEEPENYYLGVGSEDLLSPRNVILFTRKTKNSLQQEALQNRSHHRLVLACNLGTQGTVHLDSMALPFRSGQALLIFPYQFHHFSHLKSSQIRWLFCTFEMTSFDGLEPLRNRVVNVSEGSERALEVLLDHWKENHAESIQASLLYLLMSLKRDGSKVEGAELVESEGGFLNSINRQIFEWRGSPLLVSELASQMKLSDSRLRALFREAAGVPLGAYIRNSFLNRAMLMLRGTSFSVAEVAEECGFGSAQSFCRVFKKEVGVTPRAYRYEGGVSRG